MYKTEKTKQMTFADFNQSCGMKLNCNDELIVLANQIDWDSIEALYCSKFKSLKKGRPACPARVALGALIIQKRMNLSDRKLVVEIARNPYYQYFLGLSGFQTECPFKHGILPEFRKRFTKDILVEINETILKSSKPTAEHANDKQEHPAPNGNVGTLILDATCSPSNIRYPQDFSLLNEAREKLDSMIDCLHRQTSEKRRPRTNRRVLRKEYLALAKSKKRTKKKTRRVVRIMLNAVKRNMDFVDAYLAKGLVLSERDGAILDTIRELYRQQKEMFDEKKHSVENRIVSISQPFIRPIVRGKAKAPVEFGAKYDVSVDEKGHGRLETISFNAYNESSTLKDALERYNNQHGHYPSRVLADQIYRTKENRAYCEDRGVKLSGRAPGRPPEDKKERRKQEREERKNDIDRIEVERFFSRDKSNFGAGLIVTKLEETSLASVALSILVANIFGSGFSFFVFYIFDSVDGAMACHLLEFEDDAA